MPLPLLCMLSLNIFALTLQKKKKNLCAATLFLQEQPLMHAKSGAEFRLNLYVPALCWTHSDAAPCVSTMPRPLGCMLDSKGTSGWLCVRTWGTDACVCVQGMQVHRWRGRLQWSILIQAWSGRGRSTCQVPLADGEWGRLCVPSELTGIPPGVHCMCLSVHSGN